MNCCLCGYAFLTGDFYVGVPNDPGYYLHSISCGPVLYGLPDPVEPTHVRLDDGTYQRRGK